MVGIFGGELGDIESGKTGFELVCEVSLILGGEMIASAGLMKEVHEDGNLGGILGLAEFETFFLVITPASDFATLGDVREDVVFRLGDVDNPSVRGIEIVGFVKVKGFGIREGEGRLDADEEGLMLAGEARKGIKGGAQKLVGGKLGMMAVDSGAVGTEKIIANRGRMQNSKGGETFAGDAESPMTFELFVLLPGRRL